jgi:hypothetical protein
MSILDILEVGDCVYEEWYDEPVSMDDHGLIVFSYHEVEMPLPLECAASIPEFVGYVFADLALVQSCPRRVTNGNSPALVPTAVRFMR